MECEDHYAIPEWATEDLRNGQRGTDENSQLPLRGQIQHEDRLPTRPGLLLALSITIRISLLLILQTFENVVSILIFGRIDPYTNF